MNQVTQKFNDGDYVKFKSNGALATIIEVYSPQPGSSSYYYSVRMVSGYLPDPYYRWAECEFESASQSEFDQAFEELVSKCEALSKGSLCSAIVELEFAGTPIRSKLRTVIGPYSLRPNQRCLAPIGPIEDSSNSSLVLKLDTIDDCLPLPPFGACCVTVTLPKFLDAECGIPVQLNCVSPKASTRLVDLVKKRRQALAAP
ncbi:MAG: hypothetical protein KDA54_00210 [Phycisphaerales bacterium]|nr:hypothetical protein [Phycisphaerales bacterium]